MSSQAQSVWPPERWLRLETIFASAVEMPPEHRTQYITEQCGSDTELRDELESLLAQTIERDITLEEALRESAASFLEEGELAPGSRLGAWQLERELARGGMAVVYLAERADGEFRQQAALKLIKRGMDTDAVVARLRRERRILAGLDHPGISRLLDGGSTPNGHPWLALEYVAGETLDRYCAARQLGVAARCELLMRLCDAVAYAHRNLVVHGDLKPANILVTSVGQPKLLDFGIAKLLSPDPDEGGDTRTGAPRPYTPAYASPEQIRGGGLTTASDIYSLGLVAFELLAGTRPAAPEERASSAARRAGRDAAWQRSLTGDLDTIINKARAPMAAERYLSAEALGEDLQRFLARKPISARRAGPVYRARKFILRHRWATAGVAAALALAATGAGLYFTQARLAQRRFNDLRQFANSFLFDVDNQLRNLPDSTAARAVIVERSVSYLNALALERRGDADLQHEAGNAWRRVGDVQGAFNQASLGDIAGARTSYQRSLALLEPLAKRERGPRREGDARADVVKTYHELAELERIAHNSARAADLLAAALPYARDMGTPPIPALQAEYGEVLTSEAWVAQNRDQLAETRTVAAQAVAQLIPAAAREPRWRADLAEGYSISGVSAHDRGENTEAAALFKRNLEILRQLAAENPSDLFIQRDLMLAWGHLGDTYLTTAGQPPSQEWLTANAQMLAVGRAMIARDPSDVNARHDLGIALTRVAFTNVQAARYDDALAEEREALGLFGALLARDPGDKQARFYQGYAEENSGQIELARHNAASAVTWLEAAEQHYVMVANSDARDYAAQYGRLRVLGKLAQAAGEAGQTKVVEDSRHTAEELAVSLHPEADSGFPRRATPFDVWLRFGNAYAALHDAADARAFYLRSLAGWKALAPLPPDYAAKPAQIEKALAELQR